MEAGDHLVRAGFVDALDGGNFLHATLTIRNQCWRRMIAKRRDHRPAIGTDADFVAEGDQRGGGDVGKNGFGFSDCADAMMVSLARILISKRMQSEKSSNIVFMRFD
ncbi:MAG TPA: hypothetical protein VG347_00735 [Verrucomicrobiae bacterium]|nr:hypothetical protein [Verrucomicrobiae bacterium]